MDLKKGGEQVEIFETTDAMVDAILNCEDKEEARAALRVLAGFIFHDQEASISGVEKQGLPNKITLSLILNAVKNLGKPKGGE